MIYRIAYTVTYGYTAPVPFGQHLLRVEPVNRAGQQVRRVALDITPAPTEETDGLDFFGNKQRAVTVTRPHDTFTVDMIADVVVDRKPWPVDDPGRAGPPWESVREAALATGDAGPAAPAHFLFPSRRVDLADPITAYAAESFPTGRPVLAGAWDLTRRITAEFDYEPGATDVGTLASQAFAAKAGVCQDFAQVMVAGLRGLGVPAAYVSGFLRTIPPPGAERLVGADATHAWVEVWAGPEIGWVGFDPTNAATVGLDHIVLGIGRDYADVAPVDGVIVTAGLNEVTVGVDVAPMDDPAVAPPPAAPAVPVATDGAGSAQEKGAR